MAMHLLRLLHFIVVLILCVFSHTLIVNANEYYYTVDAPYREVLQEQYVDESDEEYYIKPKTVSSLRENYLKRKNKINTDMKNAKKEQELKNALASATETIGVPIETKEQKHLKDVFNREIISTDGAVEQITVINSVNDTDELGNTSETVPIRAKTLVLLKKKKSSQKESVAKTNETTEQTKTTDTSNATNNEQLQNENVLKVEGDNVKNTEQPNAENAPKANDNVANSTSNEKQLSKRDLMLQSRGPSGGGTEVENAEETAMKTKETSWLDSWLIYKDVKPMDYIGAYSIFKLLFTWPAGIKFSSNEIRTISKQQFSAELFNGSADMGFMPAFFISAGNDRFKFWRWEVELGYIPLRVSKIKSLETNTVDNPGSSFIVTKKNLGTHFFNLNFNNYIQFSLFDRSIVCFVGIGLGMGYVWSFDKDRLSSNFVLPVVSAYFGITFMISKTRKMNISYRLSYADFSINNKYAWPDANKVLFDSRPIVGGKTHFKDLFISAISIEYMFYIN